MPATMTLAQLAPTSLAFDAKVLTRASNGGKYVETTLNATRFPLVQLSTSSAPLRAPFGLSTKFEGDGGNGRLTLDLDAPPELVAWATALDEHLVAQAIAHSKAWFGKELTEATVRTMTRRLGSPSLRCQGSVSVRYLLPAVSAPIARPAAASS